MKKVLYIIMLAWLTIALSACGEDNVKSNIIVNAELTDREKGILSITSNQSFVFDFTIDSDYKEVSVWIEKYEFGKLIDKHIGYISTEVMDSGSIIFTTFKSNTAPNQIFFNWGVASNGSTGSFKSSDILMNKETDNMSAIWGTGSDEVDITNEEMVLGSICFVHGKEVMSSLSSDFYKDVEGRISEIENYDVVYLLRSKFTKLE